MIKFFRDLRSEIDQMAMDVPGLFVFVAGCAFAGAGFIIAAIVNTIFYLCK